jgi:hypothetical protein
MSHGAVGDAAKLLRKAGLILPDGGPEVPDLFWALAAVWGPTRITPVVSMPTFDQAKRWQAQTDNLGEPGWALGGDDAAAAWGPRSLRPEVDHGSSCRQMPTPGEPNDPSPRRRGRTTRRSSPYLRRCWSAATDNSHPLVLNHSSSRQSILCSSLSRWQGPFSRRPG